MKGTKESADAIVLLEENEEMIQKIVDEFDDVCERRKLRLNGEKNEDKVTDFTRSYIVRVQSTTK